MKRVLILLTMITLITTGCTKSNDKESLEIENINLAKQVTEYQKTIETYKQISKFDINSFEKSRDCEFIKTFQVYKILDDYISTNTLNKKYVILTSFQSEKLIFVTINDDLLKNVEGNNYYEFQFKVNKDYLLRTDDDELIFKHYDIISILKTSKLGLDQVNEIMDCKSE